MEIIIGKQGNQRTPITDPTVSRRHCSLTPNADGSYILRHLSKTSPTYINDQEVLECIVYPDDCIRMGNYTNYVRNLVPDAPSPVPPNPGPIVPAPPKPDDQVVSLAHLKAVWDNYESAMTTIQLRQRNIGIIRGVAPIFTIGGSVLTGYLASIEATELTAICGCLTLIGLTLMIFAFYKSYKDNSIEERKKITHDLQDKYVCPHCQRFLGMMDYNILPRNLKQCPNCKTKYTF